MSEEIFKGSCHCGAVGFEVTGTPTWTAICHCSSCRRTHSAPYAELCAYPDVRITSGKSNLSMYTCNGRSKEDRYFCKSCGSKVYSKLNHLGCYAVFLQNFTTPNHGADGNIDPRFQTISQPYIVALMTELLRVGKESVVLEVGTGSGYQAAVLGALVRQVYSLELVPELASAAAERLQRLGYHNVEVRQGDGYHGWAEHAPYDGIIVTAAAPHIPQALIQQLRVGARLVIPGGDTYGPQRLMVVTRHKEGVEEQTILPVAFVPLRHSPPDQTPTFH